MADVIVPPLQIREDALVLTMFLKEPTPETRLTAGRDYSIVIDGNASQLRELYREIDRLRLSHQLIYYQLMDVDHYTRERVAENMRGFMEVEGIDLE